MVIFSQMEGDGIPDDMFALFINYLNGMSEGNYGMLKRTCEDVCEKRHTDTVVGIKFNMLFLPLQWQFLKNGLHNFWPLRKVTK